ncbi:hypothetical protein EaACW_3445 [Erwinia amylovora ACW56400]|uniref:Uncharacterized protein n=1 Tax=Erwinia amylovora NBRC 12687 = CFBP 1232 TaxID=1219359 RepID=A0A831ELI4_ERWAM|nr:hypothetical protein EaACW_3445 [Erwinia amylovora ACW56400]CCO80283.1 hypothetical protein BN432_3514 [Erwinia amylovora Ea356]CCO84089.1 hypothetical protein BN433_3543 [Erwinia amylovora Ea266]CCO87848.1 hypothetical protein BN434_3489 [Erwinia amylovora CFBP 2585]CCO91638.1 hypothetical protein BN435_3496 [Erwinia amylovora 01SFR-BO]CCO95432.1 hypothetical protein BN437_3532 [Erwinia amylovora NBRC 12687 = CFBP 1232]CCP00752.1 hypothetical protein BN438_3497 [Erwinia amylovora UPN527]
MQRQSKVEKQTAWFAVSVYSEKSQRAKGGCGLRNGIPRR